MELLLVHGASFHVFQLPLQVLVEIHERCDLLQGLLVLRGGYRLVVSRVILLAATLLQLLPQCLVLAFEPFDAFVLGILLFGDEPLQILICTLQLFVLDSQLFKLGLFLPLLVIHVLQSRSDLICSGQHVGFGWVTVAAGQYQEVVGVCLVPTFSHIN